MNKRNKDPVSGVIGVQKAPLATWVTVLPRSLGAEIGMLVVETIAKIRRAHFVDGKPVNQICRDLNLSRKVVRKVLRSEETAFAYKRRVQSP